MPFGQVVEILEADVPNWAIAVTDTEPNANEIVLAENPFNEAPAPGNQFYMVLLEAKYLGSDSTTFTNSFTVKTLGQSGIAYTTFEHSCGVIPDEFPTYTEMFTGGAIKGWLCWQVSSADVDSLQIFIDEWFGDNRVWFDIR